MTPAFADRLDFAPARAARLALRAGTRRLAARARAARLLASRSCAAAPAGDTAPAAMPRALRAPWTGGFVALARAAGIERIEPGCDPRISASCFAPVLDAGALALDIAA